MKLFKSSDPWTNVVILLTVGLFSLSLAVKGFTHELFLEAGVFLVSVKLILMTGKNAASEERMERHLDQIKDLLAHNTAPRAIQRRRIGGQTREQLDQLLAAKAAARPPAWQARSAKPAEVNADEPTSESQACSATKTRSATGNAANQVTKGLPDDRKNRLLA